MDREVLKLKAHIDQTDADLRSIVSEMPTTQLTPLIKQCAAGRLAEMDERTALLVGLLAAMKIFDIRERARSEQDADEPGEEE